MTTQSRHPQSETRADTGRPAEISPFVLEFFMVEGSDFRGMAYRDPNGRWHKAFNHDELTGDISVLE
jgi:hypothetical protein